MVSFFQCPPLFVVILGGESCYTVTQATEMQMRTQTDVRMIGEYVCGGRKFQRIAKGRSRDAIS
ncbi:hypothetical protein AAW01_04670 [Aurantiacibacter gangjinensis]|uniref:Uncharacterized protein n=1 Tax=Aurantiacibacter gangjinensis TaxID=502682 RepID=A0A0G9MRT1_9SPHN|nr:hypothetical protein AAW01_04670 [Aurantiacibacter gangjinensis]